jgi:hypothetical protein
MQLVAEIERELEVVVDKAIRVPERRRGEAPGRAFQGRTDALAERAAGRRESHALGIPHYAGFESRRAARTGFADLTSEQGPHDDAGEREQQQCEDCRDCEKR